MNPLILIAFGIFVGVFSGVMGLGGGAVMIPIMVMLMGMTQPQAHGMSLLIMVPPVTLPAVIKYYREGVLTRDDVLMALIISAGFAAGSFFGAWIATSLPKDTLKLVFGFVLIYVAGYTIFSYFGSQHLTRSVVMAGVLVTVAVVTWLAVRWYDQLQAPAAA